MHEAGLAWWRWSDRSVRALDSGSGTWGEKKRNEPLGPAKRRKKVTTKRRVKEKKKNF